MTNFTTFAFDAIKAPARFAGTVGQKLWGGISLVFNVVAEAAMYAQASSLIRRAPEDALPLIGWERGIVVGAGESVESYRARLQAAWTSWAEGGTEVGLMSQLDPYFGGTGVVVASRDDEGGALAFPWSWFWVYYDIGEHGLSSTNFGVENTVRTIVRRWKDGSDLCRGVSLILSGRIYGMVDGYTYADAATDGLTYGDSDALLIEG